MLAVRTPGRAVAAVTATAPHVHATLETEAVAVPADLLHAPWLQVRDSLPEDGESHRFNKIGDALDVSHVQMARYLGAADYALRR